MLAISVLPRSTSWIGDPSKAQHRLGWPHKTNFDELVKEMVEADLVAVRRERERKNRDD